jgi:hypothetical protein
VWGKIVAEDPSFKYFLHENFHWQKFARLVSTLEFRGRVKVKIVRRVLAQNLFFQEKFGWKTRARDKLFTHNFTNFSTFVGSPIKVIQTFKTFSLSELLRELFETLSEGKLRRRTKK